MIMGGSVVKVGKSNHRTITEVSFGDLWHVVKLRYKLWVPSSCKWGELGPPKKCPYKWATGVIASFMTCIGACFNSMFNP